MPLAFCVLVSLGAPELTPLSVNPGMPSVPARTPPTAGSALQCHGVRSAMRYASPVLRCQLVNGHVSSRPLRLCMRIVAINTVLNTVSSVNESITIEQRRYLNGQNNTDQHELSSNLFIPWFRLRRVYKEEVHLIQKAANVFCQFQRPSLDFLERYMDTRRKTEPLQVFELMRCQVSC